MKYSDEAWTRPEPAGHEGNPPPDARLRDKAYTEQPPGGWLTVGGELEDEALNAGRLPPGAAPSVPVPQAGSITVASGTPEAPAILHLEGTFFPGDLLHIDYEAPPNAPSGADYPVPSIMDADSVAVGFASYLRGGSGFTTDVDVNAEPIGADIHFIPNEFSDGTVTISNFSLTPGPAATVTLTDPGGPGSAGIVTLEGTFFEGDVVTIAVDVDGVVTSAPVGVIDPYGTAAQVAAAFMQPQHLGAVEGITLTTSNTGILNIIPDADVAAFSITVASYAPAGGAGGGGGNGGGNGGCDADEEA